MTIREEINEYLSQFDRYDEKQVSEITSRIKDKYKVKCDYFWAGDYDSPGYDCEYYVIVFINEEGELDGVDCQCESY